MATLLERIIEEVRNGLPTERRDRLSAAQEAHGFYNFAGRQYMQNFLNDAETAADFIRRPYRESGLLRGMVDVLCEHLYAPGPVRSWGDAEADALLKKVYAQNHINALMQRAEELSCWGDAAAIQVDAAAGRYEDRPLRLHLWAPDEFCVWEDPEDRLRPFAVCTIDQYDLQTRYRLWTADSLRTFTTDRADDTSGGRVAEQRGPAVANPYRTIPFGFVHNAYPTNQFWEPGIGDLLVSAEKRVNDRLSRMDQSISKHMNPIPIVVNAPDQFQMILGQPNLLVRLNRRAQAPGVEGAFGGSGPGDPDLRYLQANPDIQAAWEDLRGYYNLVLETARIPQASWRMEQTGVASGISLLVEQAPLLSRARRRQLPAGIYEEELGRTILVCAGNYYGRPGLVAQALAGEMELAWPVPNVPVQTDDWLNLLLLREQQGLTSKIMIVMETYAMATREQAISFLRQVREDNEEYAEIDPTGPKAEAAAARAEELGLGAEAEGQAEGDEDAGVGPAPDSDEGDEGDGG